MVRELMPDCSVYTNDIDENREADAHFDAGKEWPIDDVFDWVATNPPFGHAFDILQRALPRARTGVAFLLRLSFLEPTDARGEFLSLNPPTRQIVLPRWSYKRNAKGKWATDSVTTAWMIWDKQPFTGPAIQIVPKAEMVIRPPAPVVPSPSGLPG